MARTAAAGAWPLGQWEAMARYVGCIPQDSTDGAMYRAVLAVHKDQYALAYRFVVVCTPVDELSTDYMVR